MIFHFLEEIPAIHIIKKSRIQAPLKFMKILPIFVSLLTITASAEQLHFVIPVAPGGGMDGTSRVVGRTLRSLDLADNVSYENIAGAGGGRGLSVFVENQRRYRDALLVN